MRATRSSRFALPLALAAMGAASVSGSARAANYTLSVDASKPASSLPHFWQAAVGTGTASLTLRTDLQTQYKLANRELGMLRVRGHGVLDDLGIFQWTGGTATPTYDWTKFDTYLAAIAAANMRPFMELSFMPVSLSTAGSNINPPKDYNVYQAYIQAIVQHAVDKMGAADAGQWYWEVWNEPNYSGFWTGQFSDYLTLYDHAIAGATAVLPNILVGGPVTTSGSSSQIQQFLQHVKSGNLRVAFASSHAYANGNTGNTADPTFAVSDNNTRVNDITAAAIPNVVSINSEWNSSFSGQGGNTADTCVSMDNHWNAPFIVKTVKLLADQIQGSKPPLEVFSYWTVSDIFGEGSYIQNHNFVPFGEVFGLMNFQGVRKAAWNGFKMLHYLGANRLTATGGTGNMDGVDAFAATSAAGDEVEVIVYDYYSALSSATGTDTVTLTVNNLPFTGPAYVTQFPVDSAHANPYAVWVAQGKPVTPTEAQWEAMRAAQHLVAAQVPTPTNLGGSYSGTLTLPRQGAVLVTIGKSRPVIGRDAFTPIEGEDYDGQSGVTKEDSNDTSMGQAILGNNGSYAYFEDVDLGDAGVDSVALRVNAQSATTLELRADSQTGALVGTCAIAATGGAYATQACGLVHSSGVHKLYLNFSGALHLNSFAFAGPGAGDAGTGTQTGSSSGAGSGTSSSATGQSGGSATSTGQGSGTATASSTGAGSGANASASSGSGGATPAGSSRSGCGCTVVRGGGERGTLAVLGVVLLAFWRRRRASGRASLWMAAAIAGGCSSPASPTGDATSRSTNTRSGGSSSAGSGASGSSAGNGSTGNVVGGTEADAGGSTTTVVTGSDAGADGGTEAGSATGPARPFVFTTASGAYWQPGAVTTSAGNATLTVNAATTYQTVSGFGGAFNERGWQYLQMLTPSDQAAALAFLFDANDGANFQYGRIPIGASDYAIARYTDDEVTGTDYGMSQFSIGEDQKCLIPYVKAALAINPRMHLWGSAWTPPTWMKTGPFTTSSAFDGGNMKSDSQTLQAYALYLAKWVQAYGQQGITVEMVVPQNEPSYAQGYPSCIWAPAVFDAFVAKNLGPLFASMNVSTQIFLGTMSKTSSPGDTDIMAALLADATAKPFIKGFGLQWTMQSNGSLNFSGNSGVSTGVGAAHLPIWQTEHQAGNYPWSTSTFNVAKAPNDYTYGVETWGLIRDWLKAGANSYSAWNMVLDTVGLGNDTTRVWPQDTLLVVDTTAKTVTASPAYYVFRHFSQYIQPGATRIATSGSLDSLAFKNPDGGIVTVIHNAGTSAAQTVLAVGGTTLQFSIPANGFATVVK
jgi:glucosylceramidase